MTYLQESLKSNSAEGEICWQSWSAKSTFFICDRLWEKGGFRAGHGN